MRKILSIITPFYSSSEESYLNERINLFIEKSFYPDWMERIVVDFGSPEKISKRVSKLCEDNGYVYLNLNKGRERFSAGKCRNFGAQIAKGEYLSFSDVDLLADDALYQSVYKKITRQNYFNYFEVIPCFYLTEEASVEYLNGELTHSGVYDAYLSNDISIIKATAPATSCFLLKKDFYLSEGGMRDDFFGHGYEDFEIFNRLAIKSNKFYRSHDYYSHEYKYDSLEYKGYRTFFSLFGRENLARGDYYVHIYHEPAQDSGYKESSKRNRKIFENCLLSFDKTKDSPPALENHLIDKRTLIIGWKNSTPFKSLREVIPLLGKIFYRHESEFSSSDEFVEVVKGESIDQVLFLNPYGNEERLAIYKRCKEENITFIVYDRGALPRSWFFDTNGFNAESQSYSEELWNKDLSEEQNYLAEKYISNLCTSEETLEENGERLGAYAFRKKYACLDKKVLFVPLQRPNDTVIRYFSGGVSGVDDFISRVKNLAASLPADWVICIKQHPLESYKLDVPGCIVVDDKTHVHDLIEAADAVLLINSGVGLISLCFGKPVFCMGRSFYTADGLATKISSEDNLLQLILEYNKYLPSEENVRKFIHYLVTDFYSFADTEYVKVPDGEGGAFRNMAVSLTFDRLRIKGILHKDFIRRREMLSTKAPAYDYYRAYFSNRNTSLPNTPKRAPVKPQTTAPKPLPAQEAAPKSQIAAQKPAIEINKEPLLSLNKKSPFLKKFNKLVRNPALFFQDAIKNKNS